MATVVNKDFKVKNGLVVEGSNATVNGNQVLTETASDQYIINLIGGETLVTSVESTQLEVIDGELNVKSNVFDAYGSASDAESNANTYTDTALEDYTPTNSLDTAVAGYGYAKTADLPTMYSDSDVDAHLTGGDGINYASGTISADVAGGLHISNEQIQINRNTVDGWYDAAGTAASEAGNVQDNLDTHTNATSAHGVSGNIVGTTDSQTLSNKTIDAELSFGTNGSSIEDSAGNLTVYASDFLYLTSNGGDVVLNADGEVYVGSSSAGNEVATHSYVDNAVSGLDWKNAVHLKVTSNINVAGDQVGAVFDGHGALTTANAGYRFLVTGQTTASENGIWESFQDGAALYFRRPADADVYSELVGAAVYVMEGDQYGSTSWVQGNHYLSDFTGQTWTQFSGQGSVTAGTGITVDGLEVSIDRTSVDTWYDASGTAAGLVDDHDVASGVHGVSGDIVGTSDTQTLTGKTISGSDNTLSNIGNSSLTNSSITVNGYATSLGDTVTLDTDDVAEGSAVYFTQARARESLSAGNAISYNNGTGEIAVDASQLDSDDIAEGSTNLYYTNARAKAEAASLLANATKTNIVITKDGSNNLTITAENGVADSDTDDLAEGTSHLYFTDQRAIDALQNTTPVFSAVDIDSVAKHIAATVSAPTGGSQITAYSFAKADYRSAKFLVKTAYGTHTELSEVLITLDSSDNVAITEYATIGTNGSSMTVTADVVGSDVRLRVTPTNNSSTVTVVGTLLA
jgi:hypothetical protein